MVAHAIEMVPPSRTGEQRMSALRRANEIRVRRAQFKRDVKDGTESLIDAIAMPPEWLETAKVRDMMLALPKYGRVKVDKVLRSTQISPSKTLGGLSARQRIELLAALRRG